MTRSVPLLDGIPHVDGLPFDRIVAADGARYMERHHVDHLARFHHLLADDPRDLHDHPWDFTSLLLTGGYREWTRDGPTDYWAPTVLSRRAEDPHRLELLDGPMWTLVATGPVRRQWGFHLDDGTWRPWPRYSGVGHYAVGPATPRPPRVARYGTWAGAD